MHFCSLHDAILPENENFVYEIVAFSFFFLILLPNNLPHFTARSGASSGCHQHTKANINIYDCSFDGELHHSGNHTEVYGGAIIGWANNGVTWRLHRVYAAGHYYDIKHAGFCYY